MIARIIALNAFLTLASLGSAQAQSTERPWFVQTAIGATLSQFDFGSAALTPESATGISVSSLIGYRLSAGDIISGVIFTRCVAHQARSDSVSAFSADYRIDRLSFPLMVRAAFPVAAFRNSAFHVAVSGGIALNTIIGSMDREQYRWKDFTGDWKMNGSSSLSSPYFSLVGGGEIHYTFTRTMSIIVEARVEGSMGNIHKPASRPDPDPELPIAPWPFGYDELRLSSVTLSTGLELEL